MLAAHRGTAEAAGVDWKSAVYQKVQEEVKAAGSLTVKRMVKLGRVSRSGFYRFEDTEPGPDPDMDLRDAIQKIAVEWPSYGRPRVTRELRERGWLVNPKRVYRLMREDNLLCLRKRKFAITTDSNHTLQGVPEPGAGHGSDRHQSTVAGRYHLHPAARRVRVPSRDSGRLLAPRDRLGAGSHDGRFDLTLTALRMALASRSGRA